MRGSICDEGNNKIWAVRPRVLRSKHRTLKTVELVDLSSKHESQAPSPDPRSRGHFDTSENHKLLQGHQDCQRRLFLCPLFRTPSSCLSTLILMLGASASTRLCRSYPQRTYKKHTYVCIYDNLRLTIRKRYTQSNNI